jgi:uncharacterized protein
VGIRAVHRRGSPRWRRLTILSTPTIEEAERVMKDEPLIKRELRKFELRKWELREGRMTITLNASTSKYSL